MWIVFRIAVALVAFLARWVGPLFRPGASGSFGGQPWFKKVEKTRRGDVVSFKIGMPLKAPVIFRLQREEPSDRWFKEVGLANEFQTEATVCAGNENRGHGNSLLFGLAATRSLRSGARARPVTAGPALRSEDSASRLNYYPVTAPSDAECTVAAYFARTPRATLGFGATHPARRFFSSASLSWTDTVLAPASMVILSPSLRNAIGPPTHASGAT